MSDRVIARIKSEGWNGSEYDCIEIEAVVRDGRGFLRISHGGRVYETSDPIACARVKGAAVTLHDAIDEAVDIAVVVEERVS